MTITAQVVTGQVNKHYMFGILLGVVAQIFGSTAVGLSIASTLGGAGNGVDVGLKGFWLLAISYWLNTAMGLRRRTKDAETTEVELEEVG